MAIDRSDREMITIPASVVVSDETDFTATIVETGLSATFWSTVLSDGGDILIYSSDEVTRWSLDIVHIDTVAETIEFKTKIPSISSSVNNEFWIYYGKAGASQPAASAPYGSESAYDSSTSLVYAFDKDPNGATTEEDRTSNGNDLTLALTLDANNDVLGSFGRRAWEGQSLNVDMYGTITTDASLKPAQQRTIIAIVKQSLPLNNYQKILTTLFGANYDYSFRMRESNELRSAYAVASVTKSLTYSTAPPTTYAMYGEVINTSTNRMDLWMDSVETTSSNATIDFPQTSDDLDFCLPSSTILASDVAYEELQVHNTARSAGWMETVDNNLADMGNFYTVGASEPVGNGVGLFAFPFI